MKKFLALSLAAAVLAASSAQARESGGFSGGIVGCCFGIRTAAAYNDGKDLHFREWLRLIPIANLVGAVIDGLDGYSGVTTADLRAEKGAAYF